MATNSSAAWCTLGGSEVCNPDPRVLATRNSCGCTVRHASVPVGGTTADRQGNEFEHRVVGTAHPTVNAAMETGGRVLHAHHFA